jgi:hypothetical protein
MNRSIDRSGYRGPWVHYSRAFQRVMPRFENPFMYTLGRRWA